MIRSETNHKHSWDTEVCIFQGESRSELITDIKRVNHLLQHTPTISLKDLAFTLNSSLKNGSTKLALVTSSSTDLQEKLDYALTRLADPACQKIKEISGIYFFEQPLGREGDTAFLFPGEGSQYLNMLSDLCLYLPEVRLRFDFIDRAFSSHSRGILPSQIIFPTAGRSGSDCEASEQLLWNMDTGAEAVFTANQAMFALLGRLGVRPQSIVGHSTGEYSALLAAGAIEVESESRLIEHILTLNQIYEKLASEQKIPLRVLLSVGNAKLDYVKSKVAESSGAIHLAMDNCPHQIVLCGTDEAITSVGERLRKQGAICEKLPFNRAYHTPLFEQFSEPLCGFFDRLKIVPPQIKLYSCTTAQPYPRNPDEIRKLAVAQWARPVRFRETIETMYGDGVRIFLEVGPRANLTGFVKDILRGKNHVAVASNVPHRTGITQLNHMLALLAAHAVPLNLEYLYKLRAARRMDPENGNRDETRKSSETGDMNLVLGLPLLNLGQDTNGNSSHNSPALDIETLPTNKQNDRQTVIDEYFGTMELFLQTQQRVMTTYLSSLTANTVTLDEQAASSNGSAHPNFQSPSFSLPVSTNESKEPSTVASQAKFEEPVQTRLSPEEPLPRTPQNIRQQLLLIVSEKTGYPIEMLDPTLNLEADLGVDSIKRVEILGAFQRETALIQNGDMEKLSGLKTLQQIVDFVAEPPSSPSIPNEEKASPRSNSSLPFVGDVSILVPGRKVVVTRDLSLNEDLFLLDHTLGRTISVGNRDLSGLPIMPLTMSMEMLAEAASLLMKEKLVVGMKDIRAHRWLTLENGSLTTRLEAERSVMTGTEEVNVKLFKIVSGSSGNESSGELILEGTVVFGDHYPEAPFETEFDLKDEHPSTWTSDTLYAEGMFNGPRLQGVVSLDRCGQDGAEATLVALANNHLFRSLTSPHFLTNPLLLDAAGQVIGFWTAEHLQRGFVIFPFALRELTLYESKLDQGENAKCRARINLTDNWQVDSDIDILRSDGRYLMKVRNWEDKRFDLSRAIARFVLSPQETVLSMLWPKPIERLPVPEAFLCCRLDEFADHLMESGANIWELGLAYLLLSGKEREAWVNLKGPKKQRYEWLRARLAVKDAVRLYLKKHYGMEQLPADIEITSDEYGRPLAGGYWTRQIESAPLLSVAHANGTAVAVAGQSNGYRGAGIEIENLNRTVAELENVTLTAEEQNLLSAVGDADKKQWLLRLWCAKGAVSKALGPGMILGSKGYVAKELDPSTGIVRVALGDDLAKQFPELRNMSLVAYTAQEGDLISASSLIEK